MNQPTAIHEAHDVFASNSDLHWDIPESSIYKLYDLLNDIKDTKKSNESDFQHKLNLLKESWREFEKLEGDLFHSDYLKAIENADEEEFQKSCEGAPDVPLLRLCLEIGKELIKLDERKVKLEAPSWFGTLEKKVTTYHPGLAVTDLQTEYDDLHLERIGACDRTIRQIEKGLATTNEIVAEFNSKIELEKDKVINISTLKKPIEAFQRAWTDYRRENPDLLKDQKCPIPFDINLDKVKNSDLIKYQEKCRNFMLRLQEQSKLVTLDLQTNLNLYELIVKITTSMAEEIKKQAHHIQANISKGSK